MSQYPWSTQRSVIATANQIARISHVAGQHKIKVFIDDYGWIRLSASGEFAGNMPLALLSEATEVSDAYIAEVCLSEYMQVERKKLSE